NQAEDRNREDGADKRANHIGPDAAPLVGDQRRSEPASRIETGTGKRRSDKYRETECGADRKRRPVTGGPKAERSDADNEHEDESADGLNDHSLHVAAKDAA